MYTFKSYHIVNTYYKFKNFIGQVCKILLDIFPFKLIFLLRVKNMRNIEDRFANLSKQSIEKIKLLSVTKKILIDSKKSFIEIVVFVFALRCRIK